jgi:uroporphyrinogen decarboxylase
MNSRDRVLTTFAHHEPDRVPLWFGMSPEFQANARRQLGVDEEGLLVRLGDDFRRVSATYAGPPIQLQAPDATYRTPFGVERHGLGYGQPIRMPLANATLREIHDYAWPDPAWMDVSQIRSAALAYQREYAVLGGDWSPFWHDAIDLLGMEDLLFKMHDEPALVDALLQHVVDYYFEVSRRTFDAAADAIDIFFIGNDFGSQFGPLVSPQCFARFLLPHLRRLIDLGHAYGLRVQLHCCGGFAPLLLQMIEAGLDAVHAVQPSCLGMDLARLKSEFGGRIVFNGAIDSHHALIRGTPDSVRAITRDVLRIMMPGGGYVAGASHDYILEETPVENVVAMSDAVREFGEYRRSN